MILGEVIERDEGQARKTNLNESLGAVGYRPLKDNIRLFEAFQVNALKRNLGRIGDELPKKDLGVIGDRISKKNLGFIGDRLPKNWKDAQQKE